jgi:serine/threonine protein kinase
MALTVGTKLGSHEITALLGKGGMGEVYRARDLKLKREVAIKILPEEFARDADRIGRFQREAQVLASLNHPNIAQVHGFEDSAGQTCIIMELVEGETLQERLKRGPIHLDESLPIARQIAEALAVAHEKGIIHRDLKPANIKLTPDGRAKVLDFGLAKAFQEQEAVTLSNSPTLMSASVPGMILGTAAYMSPEQAKGKETDRTTDVWAFGCVLYEMLTGRAAFQGETVGEVLAEIFKAEPDGVGLPVETPENIRRLLRRCLRKDRANRLQHIGDARLELLEPDVPRVETVTMFRQRTVFLLLVIIAVAAAGMTILIPRRQNTLSPPEQRLEITTPPSDDLGFAISPDGEHVVFNAGVEGSSQLWLRSLNSTTARPLAGTQNATGGLFWSSDNRSIGFTADGKLKSIDLNGGSPRTVTTVRVFQGGSWNKDGIILFGSGGLIYRTSSAGAPPELETQLVANQQAHRNPRFLPDGKHFVYYVSGSSEWNGVYLGDVGTRQARRWLDADGFAGITSSGLLFFARQGTLFAQNVNLDSLVLSGVPQAVAEKVADNRIGTVSASISATGIIVYRPSPTRRKLQLLWIDRLGRESKTVAGPDPLGFNNISISPNEKYLAFDRAVENNRDIWLLDVARGPLSRVTSDDSIEAGPTWSPDGHRIVYYSNRKGKAGLYIQSLGDASGVELLDSPSWILRPTDWSKDGRYLLYSRNDQQTGWDIWALPLFGDQKPFPVTARTFDERSGQFSPDGKWIVYQADDSGRFEIYVQPFPEKGERIPISTNGGAQPRWRSDGKELFYIALDGRMMAVTMRQNGASLEPSMPTPLFTTHVGGAVREVDGQQYIVSADGQRFLMNNPIEEPPIPLTVILNWKPKL